MGCKIQFKLQKSYKKTTWITKTAKRLLKDNGLLQIMLLKENVEYKTS